MNTFINNAIAYLKKQRVLYLLPYYIISLPPVIYVYFSPGFRTGPCNPGLDILVYFPLFVVNVILSLVSIAMFISKGRSRLLQLLINITGTGIMLGLGYMPR